MTALHSLPNLGTQQSPIALDTTVEALVDVSIGWDALLLEPKNDGYNPPRKLGARARRKSGYLRMDGQPYAPVDLHWHFPAEHVVGRKHRLYPAEVHIVHVHRDDVHLALQGKLDWCRIAVVGVFIRSGREEYAPMTVAASATAGARPVKVAREDIIPKTNGIIRYRGSLTTPPYSENVTFLIFDEPMTATKRQLDDDGLRNARCLQACNRRFCLHGDIDRK